MSNKKKQQGATCCFCGGTGMSKEHIWPEWMHPYLPKGETYVRAKVEDKAIVSADYMERQGSTCDITVRRVCETVCNNGWMSRLENDYAKPLLLPMLEGKKVTLGPEQQQMLATYLVMKTMVSDQTIKRDVFYSDDQRRAMFEHHTIPDLTFVDLFRYNAPINRIMQYNKEMPRLCFENGPRLITVANFTIRLHHIYVRVISFRAERMSFSPVLSALRLWPPASAEVTWPPFRSLTTPEAYSVQQTMETIIKRSAPELAAIGMDTSRLFA